MPTSIPEFNDCQNLKIDTLGSCVFDSPLKDRNSLFTEDTEGIMVYASSDNMQGCNPADQNCPQFEAAGPREKIFFDPQNLVCGIVTCGGLCPGLNNVIKSIVYTLHGQYGVKKVLGFRYGYEGVSSNRREEPLVLDRQNTAQIHHDGGTILGSSRGPQEVKDMVATLQRYDVSILFIIGGDGTFSGGHALAEEIQSQNLSIAIIGVPKTIDNDIYCSEVTFGFNTAVQEAKKSICAAHEEAKAAWNGVGLVKLMGRDSGFIAAAATLACGDVNFCFIPEVPTKLEGEDGLYCILEERLERKGHAVIVVAEGAGQDLIANGEKKTDASGNKRYGDIGVFLKNQIMEHFRSKDIPLTLKYIDPSYTIRSCPANAQDSLFCLMLGQYAVHAGMAGKTDMFVAYWHHHFTHVPLKVSANRKKHVDVKGDLWQTALSITEQ